MNEYIHINTPINIGTYDTIIQCGIVEYVKLSGQDDEKVYTKYGKIIQQLLKPRGKYFVTCVHINTDFTSYSLSDYYNGYILWSGNDGYYPRGKYGFSSYIPLKKIYQEEKTQDYYVTSIIWLVVLHCGYSNICKENWTLYSAILKSIIAPYFIHSYVQLTPNNKFYFQSWLWQFIPQLKGDKYVTPVTLEYIMFENS